MSEGLDLPFFIGDLPELPTPEDEVVIVEDSSPSLPEPVSTTNVSSNTGGGVNITADPDADETYTLVFPEDNNVGFLKNDGEGNLIWENAIGSPVGEIAVDDGSETNPPYTFANDLDSGLYSYGANQIGLTLGGENRYIIRNYGIEHLLLDQFDQVGEIKYQNIHYNNKLYLQTSNTTGNNNTFSSITFSRWNNFTQSIISIEYGNFRVGSSGFNTNIIMEQGDIRNDNGSEVSPSYSFKSDSNSGMYITPGTGLNFSYNGTKKLEILDNKVSILDSLRINKSLIEGSSVPGSSGGSLLNIDTNEFKNNTTATSGTVAEHVFNRFATPTLSATNSNITTTRASNVYIEGAPLEGINQTITESWGLINEGKTLLSDEMKIDGDVDLNANLVMNGNFNLTGTTTITGDVNITGALIATTVNGGGGGGQTNNVVNINISGNSNYNVGDNDDILLVNDIDSGIKTLTLPTLANETHYKGRKIIIVKTGNNGTINVITSGGDTIDGPTFNILELSQQYDRIHIFGDGVGIWYSI